VSIPEAMEQEPRLREIAKENEKIADVLADCDLAGGAQSTCWHACCGRRDQRSSALGIRALLSRPKRRACDAVCQDEVEEVGLVKFDFLGLKTLTILDHALRLIRRKYPEFDLINHIPLDDKASYDMM